MEELHYDLKTAKRLQMRACIALSLSLISMVALVILLFYKRFRNSGLNFRKSDILGLILSLVPSLLIILAVGAIAALLWVTLWAHRPMLRYFDFYCKNIFVKAVLKDPDYLLVSYRNEPEMDFMAQLRERKVILDEYWYGVKLDDTLTGRYKDIDFKISEIAIQLKIPREHNIQGQVAEFTVYPPAFSENSYIRVCISEYRDLFTQEELHAHRLQEKQIHRLSDCRNAFILADEMTSLDHADIEFLTGLAEGIHQEISCSSYLTFTNGKVYFLIDSWNTMIPCVLFQSLNKEAARVERSGIEVVNMFIKELKKQIQIVENAGDVRESDNSQEMSFT